MGGSCNRGRLRVQELDLRGNMLCDNGAMIIGRSMRQMQNASLAQLDLGYNEIEDDGAFTIANVRLPPPCVDARMMVRGELCGRLGASAVGVCAPFGVGCLRGCNPFTNARPWRECGLCAGAEMPGCCVGLGHQDPAWVTQAVPWRTGAGCG